MVSKTVPDADGAEQERMTACPSSRASPGGRGAPFAAKIRTQGAIMSVKKEASGRRSIQVEVEVPGTPQEAWQAIASGPDISRSEEHTSELQSHLNLACRLLLEKKKPTLADRSTAWSPEHAPCPRGPRRTGRHVRRLCPQTTPRASPSPPRPPPPARTHPPHRPR